MVVAQLVVRLMVAVLTVEAAQLVDQVAMEVVQAADLTATVVLKCQKRRVKSQCNEEEALVVLKGVQVVDTVVARVAAATEQCPEVVDMEECLVGLEVMVVTVAPEVT